MTTGGHIDPTSRVQSFAPVERPSATIISGSMGSSGRGTGRIFFFGAAPKQTPPAATSARRKVANIVALIRRDTIPCGIIPPFVSHQTILVLDFGSQYTQLIARRLRELSVYSEIVPFNTSLETLKAKNPVGIILSGGPKSVSEAGAPRCAPELFDLGTPVLGICYG